MTHDPLLARRLRAQHNLVLQQIHDRLIHLQTSQVSNLNRTNNLILVLANAKWSVGDVDGAESAEKDFSSSDQAKPNS